MNASELATLTVCTWIAQAHERVRARQALEQRAEAWTPFTAAELDAARELIQGSKS